MDGRVEVCISQVASHRPPSAWLTVLAHKRPKKRVQGPTGEPNCRSDHTQPLGSVAVNLRLQSRRASLERRAAAVFDLRGRSTRHLHPPAADFAVRQRHALTLPAQRRSRGGELDADRLFHLAVLQHSVHAIQDGIDFLLREFLVAGHNAPSQFD
jgi:hypothetical protein